MKEIDRITINRTLKVFIGILRTTWEKLGFPGNLAQAKRQGEFLLGPVDAQSYMMYDDNKCSSERPLVDTAVWRYNIWALLKKLKMTITDDRVRGLQQKWPIRVRNFDKFSMTQKVVWFLDTNFYFFCQKLSLDDNFYQIDVNGFEILL